MSAGTVITGGVESRVMVTWNDALPVLPCASVAVHVTVVVPIGNVEPETGEHVAVSGPSMLSVADAENVSALPLGLFVVSVMSAGTVTTGRVVSTIVMLNDFDALFPWLSVALQVTAVVPNPNVEPVAGVQLNDETASSGSVADAE